MSESEPFVHLQMVWPYRLLSAPPVVRLPEGYAMRTYQPGDEARFFEVMDLAGWPGWDEDKLRPWKARILPDGWFFAIHEGSGEIVASAMSLHSHDEIEHPFGGELGWVCADPAHWGKGLGAAVTSAVISRFISAGYRNIHLYTEDYRLAALKTYLRLGFVPFLCTPEMPERWRVVCEQIAWPFTPETWGR